MRHRVTPRIPAGARRQDCAVPDCGRPASSGGGAVGEPRDRAEHLDRPLGRRRLRVELRAHLLLLVVVRRERLRRATAPARAHGASSMRSRCGGRGRAGHCARSLDRSCGRRRAAVPHLAAFDRRYGVAAMRRRPTPRAVAARRSPPTALIAAPAGPRRRAACGARHRRRLSRDRLRRRAADRRQRAQRRRGQPRRAHDRLGRGARAAPSRAATSRRSAAELLVLLYNHEHIVRIRVLRAAQVIADIGGAQRARARCPARCASPAGSSGRSSSRSRTTSATSCSRSAWSAPTR